MSILLRLHGPVDGLRWAITWPLRKKATLTPLGGSVDGRETVDLLTERVLVDEDRMVLENGAVPPLAGSSQYSTCRSISDGISASSVNSSGARRRRHYRSCPAV